MFENEALIIPLAGIILPLVLVPMVMTLKFRMKKREWEHLERMRALQMGVAPAQAGHRIGPGVLLSIGTGVPAASVLAAGITSLSFPIELSDSLAVIAIAWGCAWLISTGAMITAVVLGVDSGQSTEGRLIARPRICGESRRTNLTPTMW